MRKLWQQLAIATNWPVLVGVGVLSAMGVISIWADAPAEGRKQLAFLGIAIACMAAFQAVNYQTIGRYAWFIYLSSLLLIIYTIIGQMVSVPGVRGIKGAYNWINFGAFSLQPAELAKLGFILVLARYLRFRSNYRTFVGLLAPFLLALVPAGLILKQPDLGTVLTFIPALFAMLYVAGAKIRHLLTIVGLSVALVPIGWVSGLEGVPFFEHLPEVVKPYQRQRVFAMFADDQATMQGTGFQQWWAMVAYGSGGISGKGFGNIPVGEHVPEAHNDMVFALIGEQFGFIGSIIVLVSYIVVFTTGIEIAGSTKEPFGRLVAVGVVTVMAGQTFINLLVCMKLMPVTGVTLPFVSYGGSSLIASFMSAGLLLNIGQNRPRVIAREAFEFD